MNLLKSFLLINLVTMALLLTIHGKSLTPEVVVVLHQQEEAAGSVEDHHVDVVSRFLLAQKAASNSKKSSSTPAVDVMAGRRRKTCDKFPTICNAKGSPGPHCCKKKCVDAMKDGMNCGKCGKKCKYNEICCHANCVNPSFNRSHCGGCGNNCSAYGKRGFCAFGLCNYA